MPKRQIIGTRRNRGKPRGRGRYARRRRPVLGKPSRGMRTSVYLFKRSYIETFPLSEAPANWASSTDAIAQHTQFKLNDLNDHSDFVNLFGQYKIAGVRMQIYFSQTQTTTNNEQVMVYLAPNMTGDLTSILDEQFFADNQSTKRRAGLVGSARPITVYHRCSQLAQMYGGPVSTDYSRLKPRYVSTAEPTMPHFGSLIRIQMLNNTSLANISVKIFYTYLISCRQVQ